VQPQLLAQRCVDHQLQQHKHAGKSKISDPPLTTTAAPDPDGLATQACCLLPATLVGQAPFSNRSQHKQEQDSRRAKTVPLAW
jgi:hypothetical protein